MAFIWGAYGLFLLTGFVLVVVRLYSETPQRFFLSLVLVPLILVVVGYTWTAVVLLLLAGLFAWTFINPESRPESQKAAFVEDLSSLRKAPRDDPDTELFCLQRIAEIYETLGEPELALKYYRQALERKDTSRLTFKVKQLELETRTWRPPLSPLAEALRACPGCELIESRLAYACRHCAQVFYPNKSTWFAVRFNRWCDKVGFAAAVIPGAIFLPFLFVLGAALYSLLWAAWAIGLRTRGVT